MEKFTCRWCLKEKVAPGEEKVWVDPKDKSYIVCDNCYVREEELEKQKERKAKQKELKWKASHCATCDRKSLVWHMIYDKRTNKLTKSEENATYPNNQWVLCNETCFKKWKKENVYNCEECKKKQVGEKWWYRESENDKKKFCSQDCTDKHYAPVCLDCQQKCLKTYYEFEIGFVCSPCQNKRIQKLREVQQAKEEEVEQQMAQQIRSIIESTTHEGEKIDYHSTTNSEELSIEQAIYKSINNSSLRQELLNLWQQKKQEISKQKRKESLEEQIKANKKEIEKNELKRQKTTEITEKVEQFMENSEYVDLTSEEINLLPNKAQKTIKKYNQNWQRKQPVSTEEKSNAESNLATNAYQLKVHQGEISLLCTSGSHCSNQIRIGEQYFYLPNPEKYICLSCYKQMLIFQQAWQEIQQGRAVNIDQLNLSQQGKDNLKAAKKIIKGESVNIDSLLIDNEDKQALRELQTSINQTKSNNSLTTSEQEVINNKSNNSSSHFSTYWPYYLGSAFIWFCIIFVIWLLRKKKK